MYTCPCGRARSMVGPVDFCPYCQKGRSARRRPASGDEVFVRRGLFATRSHQPVVSGGLDASDLAAALLRPSEDPIGRTDRWARRRQAVDDAQDAKLEALRTAHRAAWAAAGPGAPGIRLSVGELGMIPPDEGVPALDWWPARRI